MKKMTRKQALRAWAAERRPERKDAAKRTRTLREETHRQEVLRAATAELRAFLEGGARLH
jgi:hypothetical protein